MLFQKKQILTFFFGMMIIQQKIWINYSNSSSYYAHSKGGLVYDNDTGAFLLTSLPRYPTRDSENNLYIEMPNNTGIYAQDFLCISIDKKTSEKIVELLNNLMLL